MCINLLKWLPGLIFLGLFCFQCQPEKSSQKPNVLLLIADDLRPELGAYGRSWLAFGLTQFLGKANIMNQSTHAPLIIKAPVYEAKEVSPIVEYLDIYPTLCDLTGIKTPEHLEGNSLIPVMQNGKSNSHDEGHAFIHYRNARNLVTKRFSYTEWTNNSDKLLFDRRKDPGKTKMWPMIRNTKMWWIH